MPSLQAASKRGIHVELLLGRLQLRLDNQLNLFTGETHFKARIRQRQPQLADLCNDEMIQCVDIFDLH